MSVGEYIYSNLGLIIDYCNKNPNELDKFLDIDKSKELFDLNYAFFIETGNIDEDDKKRSPARYKTEIYTINKRNVRVTNDWYKRNIAYFEKYLYEKNISPVVPIKILEKQNLVNSRYKSYAIGNSQNALIRNILSNLGKESFSEDDWKKTKNYFNNKCAYCGSSGELVIEHAIPINREKLGEHRIGNIIPACKNCNAAKSNKDYKEYLGNNHIRIKIIDEYMKSKNYTPPKEDEKLIDILNMAYKEVSIIADRYIKIINNIFINKEE
jgi:5-methylcytosine-specific restriction endonuclease McrA